MSALWKSSPKAAAAIDADSQIRASGRSLAHEVQKNTIPLSGQFMVLVRHCGVMAHKLIGESDLR